MPCAPPSAPRPVPTAPASSGRSVFGALLFGSLLSGCASSWGAGVPAEMPRDAVSEPAGEAARCVRLVTTGPRRRPLPGAEPDPQLAAELDVFPPDVRRTIFAAGLEQALSRLLHDRKAGLPIAELMTRRHAIELHLHSLKVQVDSTTFEADCTGDVIEGVQTDLDTRNNVHAVRWTVASTVTGALTAASAGAWDLADED